MSNASQTCANLDRWHVPRVGLPWDTMELSQPFTTRQMNINPYPTMATHLDPRTDSYKRMNSAKTIWDTHASLQTPYGNASTAGPDELAYHEGGVPACSPAPLSYGVQQPNVMASHDVPALVRPHHQPPTSQRSRSRRLLPDGSRNAQRNCRQNRNLVRGKGCNSGSRHGPRCEEPQRAGGNRAFKTTFVPPCHGPHDCSLGRRECSSFVPAGRTSAATRAVHVAHGQDPSASSQTCSATPRPVTPELYTMSKNKCFTDALIHAFIKERLDNIMAELNGSKGCKGAEQTHRLSYRNLDVCLPSKRTGSLHLKIEEAAPRTFTASLDALDAVRLSSAGNAGRSTVACTGNEQMSTALGKGIPEEHEELTRNVEKQDGHTNHTPESTGTPDLALNTSHTVCIYKCIEESPDSDLTKSLHTNVLCETGSKPVSNNSCVDEKGYDGAADHCKTQLSHCDSHGTGANELSTVPTLSYSFRALKELVSRLTSISYETSSPTEDVLDVIMQCYWNGNKDAVHVFASTEYPHIMWHAAAVCAKNEDENPVILSAVSGLKLEECIERHPALKVGNSGTPEEVTSSWLNINDLFELDKEPGALRPMSSVCHPEVPATVDRRPTEKMDTVKAGKHTQTDTTILTRMSTVAVKEAPWFKSQKYEDISDDDIQNGQDMAIDLQSNRLPSETIIGNWKLSGTSSNDCPVYEDISDAEISTKSLIVEEPLIAQPFNNVKQPTESQGPRNDPAVVELSLISAKQSSGGTSNGGLNSQDNKGPGLIYCLLPEMYTDCSPQQAIYISSDEDLIELSTEEDGHAHTQMHEHEAEDISLKVNARSNFPQTHKKVMRSCNSPLSEILDVKSTEVSQHNTELKHAEEDRLVSPVSIADPAQTQCHSEHIPPQPLTTNKLECRKPSSVSNTYPKSCSEPNSQIIVVSDEELPVPKPTAGNIPTEPSHGNTVPRCRKGSSSSDTDDSSDYSSSQSCRNYLTVSSQLWENRNRISLKRKKKYSHSRKVPCTNPLSDSMEKSCGEDVQVSLKTDPTMAPETTSSPADLYDEDKLCQTKANRTSILRGLKRLTADGEKLKGRSRGLSSSESEDNEGLAVLQNGRLAEGHRSPVKGPQQMISLEPEIAEEPPSVAGAEQSISHPHGGLPKPSSIIPRLFVQMTSKPIEPLILAKNFVIHKNEIEKCRLSKETKKKNQDNSAHRHPRNQMEDKKLRSKKQKVLDGSKGEPKINALNTVHHVTSSKPTSVSNDHLITPKRKSRAASQKNTGHSRVGTESSRRAAFSGIQPSRTASSGEHAALSPTETSPSSTYPICFPTSPKKRISHYTNKSIDSINQQPSLFTPPASRSKKAQFKSSTFRRQTSNVREGTSSDASGSTKVSARQQVRNDWQDSFFPTGTKRRHSSEPEDARHCASTSQNALVLEPQDAGLEPSANVAKHKNSSCTASTTPLMKRTISQAKRLTQAAHPRDALHQRNQRGVGEGYKWCQTQKNMTKVPKSHAFESF